MGFGNAFKKMGTSIGQKRGFSGYVSSGVKTGYDNYMANNKPASVSTSSANMLQSPSVSEDGGLAASAIDTTPQQTLTSGIQNPVTNSTVFGNMVNGLGGLAGLAGSKFDKMAQYNQGMQNQYGIIDGAQLI